MKKTPLAKPLTKIEFREYLVERTQAETLTAIGQSLGVTRATVQRWLAGKTPRMPVLVLAGHLQHRDQQRP